MTERIKNLDSIIVPVYNSVDFLEECLNSIIQQSYENWGIPVRPHDVNAMHTLFDALVYEFHISYSDLNRAFPNENWSFL